MTARFLIVTGLALGLGWPAGARAEPRGRPVVESLPVPLGFTHEQVALGDRIFHGEAARGQCSQCHGADAKGSAFGNDLTSGLFIWSDGSVKQLKRTILHNMQIQPRMDGDLTPADVDAVAAYVWAISHQGRRSAETTADRVAATP